MINCKQVAGLLSSGELERQGYWMRFQVRFHLWMCKHCSRFARQLEQIFQAGQALRASFQSEGPGGGPDSLEARVLKKVATPPSSGKAEEGKR